MELAPEEAGKLSGAIAEVAAQYNFVLDPKKEAWLKLYGALGVIYGSRFLAIRLRRKMDRADAKERREAVKKEHGDNVEILRPESNLRPGSFGGPGANLDGDSGTVG